MKKQTLVIAEYVNGETKEFLSGFSKEAIYEIFDHAFDHFWTYVILEEPDMIIPMSGLEGVHLYELPE